jgi:hypothetical protein
MPLHGLGHEFGKQAAALVQILSCLATSYIDEPSWFRGPTNYFEKASGSEFRFDPVLRSRDCENVAAPSQVRLYRRLEGNMAKVFADHVQKHGRFAAFTIEAERPRKDNLRSMPNVTAAFRHSLKNLEKIAMSTSHFRPFFRRV